MTDRRELIITRLVEIADAIPGIGRGVRNEQNVTGKSQAVIVVWDGDEGVDPDSIEWRRPANAPQMVEMTPELRILLEEPAATIGTSLNALRIDVIKAVIDDALSGELRTIIGSNGGVRYVGAGTDLGVGRATEGGFGIRFTIRYPLIRAELS